MSLIHGRNSSTRAPPGAPAEHVDQRDELVGVGSAARHRVRVPVGVDERRRQSESARSDRHSASTAPSRSASSGVAARFQASSPIT